MQKKGQSGSSPQYAVMIRADGSLWIICPNLDEQQAVFKAINKREIVVRVKAAAESS